MAQTFNAAGNAAGNTAAFITLVPATEIVQADSKATDMLVAACLAAAAGGDNDALFDLIEAHKWFNLAAVSGHEEAALCRAEIADDMTAREIAEAQRRAREWLRSAKPDTRAA
jgi:uncharacterized protein